MFTVGRGNANARGEVVLLPDPSAEEYANAIKRQAPRIEAWWAPVVWTDNHRLDSNWSASTAAAVDVDYQLCGCAHDRVAHDKSGGKPKKCQRVGCDCAEYRDDLPSPETVSRLLAAVPTFPGSLFHLTPHGCRFIFVFSAKCTDRLTARNANLGAGDLVARALKGAGIYEYEVDKKILPDLARFFYTPNSIAKGKQRQAELIKLTDELYLPESLTVYAPPPEAGADARNGVTKIRNGLDPIERWNTEHPIQFERRSAGRCPICNDSGSFGRMPNDDTRWYCFSTDHPNGIGIAGAKGYHGDALDLEAHATGLAHVEILRRDGYIRRPRVALVATAPMVDDPGFAETGGAAPPPIPMGRNYRSHSYLTAVDIISSASKDPDSARGELDGKSLLYNEMTGEQELGGDPVCDEDVTKIRSEIERKYCDRVNKHGEELGLQLSRADIESAVNQVAKEKSYHPVREYLQGLTWDGIERINSVAEDILSAPASVLNNALVRRFFVGAVRRVFEPGCKLDTMLILQGGQGQFKSTFFKTLASAKWFVDSQMDIRNKDSFQVIRRGWIVEWPELDSISRAREVETVKSFLASSWDTYRAPFGKHTMAVKRSGVIVGTTNQKEFLVDDTGNRRFWPLVVGKINIPLLVEQRDQLWAEAVVLYRAGEACFLSEEEVTALNAIHEDHVVSDAWEELVVDWLDYPRLPQDRANPPGKENPYEKFEGPPTTTDVIIGALHKPIGQWTRADEMRISKCMKHIGYTRVGIRTGDRVRRYWKK